MAGLTATRYVAEPGSGVRPLGHQPLGCALCRSALAGGVGCQAVRGTGTPIAGGLAAAGVLVPVNVGRRNRAFEAPEGFLALRLGFPGVEF